MGRPNVALFNTYTNRAYDEAGGAWYDWNQSGQLSPWEHNQLIEGGRLRNKDTAKGIWEKKFQSLYGFGFEEALNRQDEFTGWTGGEAGKGYVYFTPISQKKSSGGGGGGGGGGPSETDIQALVKSLLLEDVKETPSENPGRLDAVSVKTKRDRERTSMKILSRTPPSALESIRAGARRAGLNLPV